jgi:hypothetical protein
MRFARRRWGVTVPEIAEEFDVEYWTAHRLLQRMVRQGFLRKTNERRRRTEIFESPRGAGGIVYRATRAQHDYTLEFEDGHRKGRKPRRGLRG